MNRIKKEIDDKLCELAKGLDEKQRRSEEHADRLIDLAVKIDELERSHARSMAQMRKYLDEEIERRMSLERLLAKLQSDGADKTRKDDIEDLEAHLTTAEKIRQRLINKIVRISKR